MRLSAISSVFFSSLLLICTPLQAAPIGDLVSLNEQNGQLQLKTDQQVLLQIQLVKADVLRLQAGLNATLRADESKAARIVEQLPLAKVHYTLSDQGDYHQLKTSALSLRIYKKPLRFALYQADNQTLLTEELQPLDLETQQFRQTLSSVSSEHFYGGGQQNGAFEFKGKTLEISYSGGWEEGDRPSPAPFYMSSRGYGVFYNSWHNGQYDFRADDTTVLSHQDGRFDLFWFAGGSLANVLAAYTELTGRAKLIPRWAFEYGDADCYNDGDNVKKPGTVPTGWTDGPTGTTPDVIESVAKQYRQHQMPGGWILPNDGYGCGYTDLPKVVKGLAQYGFHTGLWTENGVNKIAWEVGSAGSRAQKLDVAWTGQGYQFALDANQAAAQGILNNSDARPFLWTVMGWAGIQRYAVTWTGDQSSSWDYIRWHIPTLIGSGLSGQAYASGDVDAIFGGSAETFTRDLQWKSFTPVLMGMSGWSKSARKHPWWYDEPYRSINRDYLMLKMRLTPYMYTTAWQSEQTGAPIVRGMMWDASAAQLEAQPDLGTQAHPYQFMLGRDLLIAPVYRSQSASQGWREDIFLPQGEWIDYWDGRVVRAPIQGQVIDYKVDLKTIPVFVRAGAIIPMYPAALYDGEKPKDVLTLDIYPSGQSSYTLYEDDGITRQYQQGAHSLQAFTVDAPINSAGDISIELGAVQGSYQGQLPKRQYQLQVHSRIKPTTVLLATEPLPELTTADAYAQAEQGWFWDEHQYGVARIKTGIRANTESTAIQLQVPTHLHRADTALYPAAPDLGNEVPVDSLLVLNRPPEEAGYPLENMFDHNPTTWFRSKRDQAIKTGAHEFSLALGERRLIEGFQIAPRNDQHWQYGQVADYELYLADSNGEWGTPVARGRLKKQQTAQQVHFKAKAGALVRFRILSSHDQLTAAAEADPMVTAATSAVAAAYNAILPKVVTPITISEFQLLEQKVPKTTKTQLFLATKPFANTPKHAVQRIVADKEQHSAPPSHAITMNGLRFLQGFQVPAHSQLDFALTGQWQLFRADLGVDDRCRQHGAVEFEIWGDGKLLYSSGAIASPAVVKPELDIRGIMHLSLRTKNAKSGICANWANAQVIGWPLQPNQL